MTDTFSRDLWISVGAHGLIGVLMFFRIFLFPSESIDLRESIRVDIVGLPEKMTEPPKLEPPGESTPPPQPEVKKTQPVPTPKPTAPTVPSPKAKKDLAKSQKDILAKLNKSVKMDNALDKIKESLKKDADGKQGTKIAGNTVSQGNSLTGLQRLDFDRYISDVRTQVYNRWNIPQWLADAGYKAQMRVMIDERGYVIKKVMLRSSGNEVFDGKVHEAIDSSSPFPPPPDRLRGFLSTNGAVFNFPE